MPINLDPDALALLNLKHAELESLTEEEAWIKIQKAWRLQTLKYHPDRNKSPEAKTQFEAITKARDKLFKLSARSDNHSINQYFTKIDIQLSETDFDLRMQDRIEQSYHALLQEFTLLDTEEGKKTFAQENAAFISLAQQLLPVQHDILSYYRKWEARGFVARLIDEWRSEMIAIFGEEYLDDFDYRHALATGELYPILATRKLFSPLKLALAAALTMMLSVKVFVHYLRKNFSSITINLTFILLSAYIPVILTLFAAKPIVSLLHIIATPVNSLIRPLAKSTSLNPELLTMGTAMLGLGLVILTTMSSILSFSLVTKILLLIWIYRALSALIACCQIAIGIVNYKANQKIWSIVSFCLAALTLYGLIYSLSYGAWFSLDGFSNFPLEDIFWGCLNLVKNSFIVTGICYQAVHNLQHFEENLKKMMQSFPLPEVPVSEAAKNAVRQRVQTGDYSNHFFNTSPQAKCLKESDRTLWQKSCSFFGGGFQCAEQKTASSHELADSTNGYLCQTI